MFLTALYAFISTIGFSILFNTPKKNMIHSGLAGALGWITYVQTQDTLQSVVFAAFAGAFVVGIMGEIFSRIYKIPETLFVVPGIIPLVPGYGIYYTMLKAVENDYSASLHAGIETFLVAIAIASAVISTTSIGRVMKRWLKGRAIQQNIAESIENSEA